MKLVLVFSASALVMSGPAVAQETAPLTAAGQVQEAPQGDPKAAASVSDAEVDRFALAALLVQQIAADQAVEQEQKQAAMAAAVQQTGIQPQRFNEIAKATQDDQELNERVQLAAARHVEAAQQSQ